MQSHYEGDIDSCSERDSRTFSHRVRVRVTPGARGLRGSKVNLDSSSWLKKDRRCLFENTAAERRERLVLEGPDPACSEQHWNRALARASSRLSEAVSRP
jgi:hypothetical protein